MVLLLGQIVDLGVTVVAGCDAVFGLGCQDLVGFAFAIGAAFFRVACLEKTAAATATVIVGTVGIHFNEIFFTHYGSDHITQVFGHRIPKGFSYQLTRILYSEFDLALPVPLGADLEFAFTDPLGVVLNDAPNFEFVVNLEFVQSGPDCEEFVPSLGVEKDLTLEIVHRLGLDLHNVFPIWVVGHKHAIVFGCPPLGPVGPVSPHKMENFPERHHFVRFCDGFA